jgi:hypothetical protein
MRAWEFLTEQRDRKPPITLRALNQIKHDDKARAASRARQLDLVKVMYGNPAKEHERIDLEKARLEFAQLKAEIADQESDALADSFEHISKSALSASAAGRKDAQAVTKMARAERERRRLGRARKV